MQRPATSVLCVVSVFVLVSGCYDRPVLCSSPRYSRQYRSAREGMGKLLVYAEEAPRGEDDAERASLSEDKLRGIFSAAAKSADSPLAGVDVTVQVGGSLEEALSAAEKAGAEVVLRLAHDLPLGNATVSTDYVSANTMRVWYAKDVPSAHLRATALPVSGEGELFSVKALAEGKASVTAAGRLMLWSLSAGNRTANLPDNAVDCDTAEAVYGRAVDGVLKRFTDDPADMRRYRTSIAETVFPLTYAVGGGISNPVAVDKVKQASPVAHVRWIFGRGGLDKPVFAGLHIEHELGGEVAKEEFIEFPLPTWTMKSVRYSVTRVALSLVMTSPKYVSMEARIGFSAAAVESKFDTDTSWTASSNSGFYLYAGCSLDPSRAFSISAGMAIDGGLAEADSAAPAIVLVLSAGYCF